MQASEVLQVQRTCQRVALPAKKKKSGLNQPAPQVNLLAGWIAGRHAATEAGGPRKGGGVFSQARWNSMPSTWTNCQEATVSGVAKLS